MKNVYISEVWFDCLLHDEKLKLQLMIGDDVVPSTGDTLARGDTLAQITKIALA